jgi:hypothetical protein
MNFDLVYVVYIVLHRQTIHPRPSPIPASSNFPFHAVSSFSDHNSEILSIMVCATRPKSRSHETSGASANYKYAIMLPEGRGYLYIQELPVGANGAPQLVYSIETGKTCVRKQTRLDSVDETGFPNEVEIGRSLAGSGFVPFILEHNMVDDDRSFIIFEYCNGGDFDSYMKNKARSEEAAEVLIWHVIARAVRILTYLQTGQVGGDADAAEGPIKANDNQAWRSGNVPKPERYVKMEIVNVDSQGAL